MSWQTYEQRGGALKYKIRSFDIKNFNNLAQRCIYVHNYATKRLVGYVYPCDKKMKLLLIPWYLVTIKSRNYYASKNCHKLVLDPGFT